MLFYLSCWESRSGANLGGREGRKGSVREGIRRAAPANCRQSTAAVGRRGLASCLHGAIYAALALHVLAGVCQGRPGQPNQDGSGHVLRRGRVCAIRSTLQLRRPSGGELLRGMGLRACTG